MKKETYKDFMKPGRKVDYWDFDGIYPIKPDYITKVEVRNISGDVEEDPEKWDDYCEATVETKEGHYWEGDLYQFSPVYSITDCDADDLKKIFGEISPGSIYVSDFQNSLNVDADEVSHYCDGFEFSLVCDVREEHPKISDDNLVELVNERETAQAFADYCMDVNA